MRRVFDCWPQIASRIKTADSVALFLDFDGTLARIRSAPDEAQMNQPTRLAVARLAANPRARVWIISGRKQADVQERTRVANVQYMGLHGWEGRSGTALRSETQRTMERVRTSLVKSVGQLPGILIEDKGPAFAIHYRNAGDTECSVARDEMYKMMGRLNGDFRLLSGKKVWEILPTEVGDKGSAVRREMVRFKKRALPVYIGDDVTDERAFAAIPDGVTIRVGPRALTHARFQLRDPNDVRLFLEQLEMELS
jgi:trehalose-phosphatase